MNTLLKLILLPAVIVLMAGNALAEDIVAKVDGEKITKKDLEAYAKYRQTASKQQISNPNALLQEMINREILYRKALKAKVGKQPGVKYLIEQQRRDLLIQALLRKSEVAKPIDEKEIKKIYAEKIKTQKLKEYKVKHVLVKTEADAKTVIAELDGGAVFEDIAKNKSQGPSAKKGGSIGWVNPAQLKQMPAFAQAITEMEKGSTLKKPVQTRYGWHVIKLEDSRKLEPPAYNNVKKQIENALRQKRLQAYVQKARKKAKVEITKTK